MIARARSNLVPFRSVLVPTDFTEGSDVAIDRAVALPLAQGARLEILHVLPASIPAKIRTTVEARAREALANAATRAVSARRDTLEVTSAIVRGAAHVEIIRRAVAVVCWPVFRSDRMVSRREGIAFVAAYAVYLTTLLVFRT